MIPYTMISRCGEQSSMLCSLAIARTHAENLLRSRSRDSAVATKKARGLESMILHQCNKILITVVK